MSHLTTYLRQIQDSHSRHTQRTYNFRLNAYVDFARKKHGGRWQDTEVINEFILHLLKIGTKKSTIKSYQQILSSYFTWLCNSGHLTKNPLEKVTALVKVVPKTRKEVFTPEEYQKIKDESLRHASYWKPAIVIAWNTGLRLSDVAQLERSELDLAGSNCIRLKPQKTEKFGTEVEIPISSELRVTLEELLAKETGEFILPQMAEIYRCHPEYLSVQFTRLARKAGVMSKSFHHFRHSWISRCLDHNVNPAVIATMTGQTLAVILRYCHPSLEAKREQMKGML